MVFLPPTPERESLSLYFSPYVLPVWSPPFLWLLHAENIQIYFIQCQISLLGFRNHLHFVPLHAFSLVWKAPTILRGNLTLRGLTTRWIDSPRLSFHRTSFTSLPSQHSSIVLSPWIVIVFLLICTWWKQQRTFLSVDHRQGYHKEDSTARSHSRQSGFELPQCVSRAHALNHASGV